MPFARAKVGDRYVTEMLLAKGWQLGGETSGHVLCLDLNSTGDAIVAALQALVPMVERGCALHDLLAGMHKLPQVMVNVEVPDPTATAECAALKQAIVEKEATLAERGRILVRPSGTEPLLRVMVEGEAAEEVSAIANELAAVAAQQT